MKLSEKIVELRKACGMTQEELAAICSVSRQSISKWEADIALPETEKLLVLGETFHVSMDILLKDDLTLNEVREVQCCGSNAVHGKKKEIYEGILIKESLTDDAVIDLLHVHKVELWEAGGNRNIGRRCILPATGEISRSRFPGSWCRIPAMGGTGSWTSNRAMKSMWYSGIRFSNIK